RWNRRLSLWLTMKWWKSRRRACVCARRYCRRTGGLKRQRCLRARRFSLSCRLPYLATICRRSYHGRTRFAGKRCCEFRHIGKRPNHSIFRYWMRIALHHQTLRLRANCIAAPLPPCDEELLIRGKALERRGRVLLLRLFEGEVCDFCSRKVADTLAQHQLSIVVDVRLNVVTVKLAYNARRFLLKTLHIVGCPPIVKAALRIELCALIVKAMADFMPNHHANRAVINSVHSLHVKSRRLENAGREDNLIHQWIVISIGSGRRHASARDQSACRS